MYVILLIGILLFIFIELYIFIYGIKREDVICEYIIILGAGLHGNQLSSALIRRLKAALIYVHKYPHIPIVVSGGQGRHETCTEAHAMRAYLIQHGIEATRIVEEDMSVSTYTNFKYTKHALKVAHASLMVVTCDFHMLRAIKLGKRAGFTCYRWPAKSVGIHCIKYYIREFFCVLKYAITKQ